MCHHHEAREWSALREELEEAEPDGVEGEEALVDPAPETADSPDESRLPPIQPSD